MLHHEITQDCAPSGTTILIISCGVCCAIIFKTCSEWVFEIREKRICKLSPDVCIAARFLNSCSVGPALVELNLVHSGQHVQSCLVLVPTGTAILQQILKMYLFLGAHFALMANRG